MTTLYAPARREGGGGKRCFCLSVRLCVAYIANNSRTQRPSMPKFKVKEQGHKLTSSVRLISASSALSVATALVSSCLDYTNSILFRCPLKYCAPLQRVQNALARITVPQNSSFPLRSTTALLRHSHWLPIDSRISSELSTTTYKALGSGRPPYLASLLHNYSSPRTMRSSSGKLLTVPHHNLSLSSRAFRISAHTKWNSLPQNVREFSS